jgi:superkiller protein 3
MHLDWTRIDDELFEDLCGDTIRALLSAEGRGAYRKTSMRYRRDFQRDGVIESGGFEYLRARSPVNFSFKTADVNMDPGAASQALKRRILRSLDRLLGREGRSVVFYTNHDLRPKDQEDVRSEIKRRVGSRAKVYFQGRTELEQCFRAHPHLLWKYFDWCEFINSCHSTDADGLRRILIRDALASDVGVGRVLHPKVVGVSVIPHIRVRITGKPGAGKSVALWQLLSRLSDTEVVLLTCLDAHGTLPHLKQIVQEPGSKVAVVIDDLHEKLTDPSVFEAVCQWARNRGPHVGIFVAHRTTERAKVEATIPARRWEAWGFAEANLDEPPAAFIREVISVACEDLHVDVAEELRDQLVQFVTERENTPAFAVSALRLYRGTRIGGLGLYPVETAVRERADDWKQAFAALIRDGRCAEVLVLKVVSALYAAGLRSPSLEAVRDVCQQQGGIGLNEFELALGHLQSASWLNVSDGLISAHDIQVALEVAGLVADGKASLWLDEFCRMVDEDRFLSLRSSRSTILLHLSGLYARIEQPDRVVAISDRVLQREPDNIWALRSRALGEIRRGNIERGICDLRAALKLSPDTLRSWHTLFRELLKAGSRSEARQLISEFTSSERTKPGELYFAAEGYRLVADSGPALEWARRLHEVEPSGMAVAMIADATAMAGAPEEALLLLAEGKGRWQDEGAIHSVESEILWRLGRNEEALSAAKKALALSPNEPSNHAQHAVLLLVLERPATEVAEAVRVSKRIFPEDPALLAVEGTLHEAMGQPADAVTVLRRALRHSDLLSPIVLRNAYLSLACSLLSLGQAAEAQMAFQRAQEEGMPKWFCAVRKARVYRDSLCSPHEALAALQEAVGEPDASEDPWLELASLSEQTAGSEAAQRVLTTAASRCPESFRIQMDLGKALGAAGDHSGAAEAFRLACKIRPESAGARNPLTIQLIHLKQYSEALPVCSEAIRLEPDEAEHYRSLGLCLRYLGRHQEAIAAFDEVLARNPLHGAAMVNKAESLTALERWEEALEWWERADAAMPRESTTVELMNRGSCLAELGRLREARQWFEAAVQREPGLAATHYNLGYTLSKMGLHQSAIKCYEQTLHCDGQFRQAWLERARSHLRLGEYDLAAESLDAAFVHSAPDEIGKAFRAADAEKHVANLVHAAVLGEELLSAAPRSSKVQLVCAKIEYSSGRLASALKLCDSLLSRQPDEFEALLVRSRVLNRLGRLGREVSVEHHLLAANSAESAGSLRPASGESLLQHATALAGLGNAPEALRAFERARSLCATDAEDWTMAGFALGWIDAHEEALEAFSRALIHEPQRLDALRGKANALRLLGHPSEAESTVEQALAIDPKNNVFLETKATLLLESGRAAEAAGVFAEALESDGQDARLHLGRAMALGACEEAKTHFRRAIELMSAAGDRPALGSLLALAYRKLGILEFNDGSHANALEHLSKASELDPEDFRAHETLGVLLTTLGRYDQAKVSLEKAIAVGAGPLTRYYYAAVLDKTGDAGSAAEQRRIEVESLGDSLDLHAARSEWLLKMGLTEGALAHMKRLTELAADDDRPHVAYANACSAAGRAEDAETHYELALQINSHCVHNHLGFASHLARHGKSDEAAEHWDRAYALHMESSAGDLGQWLLLTRCAFEIGDIRSIVLALSGALPNAKERDADLYQWLSQRATEVQHHLTQTACNAEIGGPTGKSELLNLAAALDDAQGNITAARSTFRASSLLPADRRSTAAVMNWCTLLIHLAESQLDDIRAECDEALVVLKETISSVSNPEQRTKLGEARDRLEKLLQN